MRSTGVLARKSGDELNNDRTLILVRCTATILLMRNIQKSFNNYILLKIHVLSNILK